MLPWTINPTYPTLNAQVQLDKILIFLCPLNREGGVWLRPEVCFRQASLGKINPICAPNPANFWLWIRLSTTWLLSIPISLELKSSQAPHLWDIFLARIFERHQRSYFLELHFEKTSTWLLESRDLGPREAPFSKTRGCFLEPDCPHTNQIFELQRSDCSPIPTAPSCALGLPLIALDSFKNLYLSFWKLIFSMPPW